MSSVSKSQIAAEVAVLLGQPEKTVASVIDQFLNQIGGHTANGGRVTLVGFGRFEMRDRAATTGRNPKTGEAIEIPASSHLAFKAAKH